jgi:uncharacterized membrane-anchored protein YitT (DUF2179 family)
MQLATKKMLYEIKDYVVITFGLLLYAVGFNCFQLPYGLVGGGVAGIGSIIFFGTGFPVQYTFFIVNGILLLAAIRLLGWRFCLKTIYGVTALSILLGLVQGAVEYYGQLNPELVGDYKMPLLVDDNKFMAALLAAGIEGIGLGMVLLNNGSTGGTDIIASIINKYKDVTLGQMMMICDVIIVSSCMILPDRTLPDLLYGFIVLFTLSVVVDYVIDRSRQSVQFFIFSNHYEEIAAGIAEIHRGVTILNGQGWYTKAERKVLVVLAKKRESTNIFRIIQSIDPGAFVSQSKVIGVYGEGFDKIKVKAEKKNTQAVANPTVTERLD